MRHPALLLLLLALPACGTRSSASISGTSGPEPAPVAHAVPDRIPVFSGDVSSKPYRVVGDVQVSVSKWMPFDTNPTEEDVNIRLRQEAAAAGADAVILARYGTVGFGILTWGKLEGRGRAIAYVN